MITKYHPSYLLMLMLVVGQSMWSCSRYSERREATVTHLNDGDSFIIEYQNGDEAKIRIYGIDSPELSQAYGRQARQSLANKIKGKEVRIVVHDSDRYGRLIADVYLEDQNIAHWLLEKGLSWHYKKYSHDRTYAKLERQARRNKTGLWQDKNPTPPWAYRKQQRK